MYNLRQCCLVVILVVGVFDQVRGNPINDQLEEHIEKLAEIVHRFDNAAPSDNILKSIDEKQSLLNKLPEQCSNEAQKQIASLRNIVTAGINYCDDLADQRKNIKNLATTGTKILSDFSSNVADIVVELIGCPFRSPYLQLGCILKIGLKISYKFPHMGSEANEWRKELIDIAEKTYDDVTNCYAQIHQNTVATGLASIEDAAKTCLEKVRGNPINDQLEEHKEKLAELVHRFDNAAPSDNILKSIDEKQSLLNKLPEQCSNEAQKQIASLRNIVTAGINYCDDLADQRKNIKNLATTGTKILSDFSSNVADIVVELIGCPFRSPYLQLGCILKIGLKISYKFPHMGSEANEWRKELIKIADKTYEDVTNCYAQRHQNTVAMGLTRIEDAAKTCLEKK